MITRNLRQICFPSRPAVRLPFTCYVLMFAVLLLIQSACGVGTEAGLEILVGIEQDSVHFLAEAGDLKPGQTGISSLDALNEKWFVREITPVFPDVSPDDEIAKRYGLRGVLKLVVPARTNIETMLAEYQANPHVAYAEINKPVEIN